MNLKDDLTAVGVLGAGGAEAASKEGLVQVITSEQFANMALIGNFSIGAVVSGIVMFGAACYALHRAFMFGCIVYDRFAHKNTDAGEV